MSSFHVGRHRTDVYRTSCFNYDNIKNVKAYNSGYRVGLLYKEDESDSVGKLKAMQDEETTGILD